MHPKLSVALQIDLEARQVYLRVTGRLTRLNQRALSPVITRSHALAPDLHVVVDLTAATQVEAEAVELLRGILEHDSGREVGRVEFLVPGRLRAPVPATGPAGAAAVAA